MNTDRVNVSAGMTAAGAQLALRGFDPVSYFTEGAPRKGEARFAVVHEGAAYYFSSEANAASFKTNPERYLPSFGGFCAYGVSVGKKFDGDPQIFKMVDGRLHLNLNSEIHQAFLADPAGAVAKADAAWARIADKPAGVL